MITQSPTKSQIRLLLIVFCGLFAAANFAYGQTWVSNNVPSQQWSSIACSADGTRLAATVYGGGIYCSTNSGATWTTNNSTANKWLSVASSADGIKLVAGVSGGGVYVSTNAGNTWILSNTNTATWKSVASSANGARLFAAAYPGNCYYSTNSGTSWTTLTNLPSTYWSSIACSADGTKLVALRSMDDPPVYVSTNAGDSWTTNLSIIGMPGAGAATSADGGKLFVISDGFTYISTDSGASWNAGAHAGNGCNLVACSADGTQLFTADRTQASPPFFYSVYISTNSGTAWMNNVISTTANNAFATVISVAASADGTKLALANGDNRGVFVGGGHSAPIYTYQSMPNPQLNISTVGTNLAFSWTVPSTHFLMQQSIDLFNWANITIAPVLDFTNLQYQIILSPSNSSDFYRLATP